MAPDLLRAVCCLEAEVKIGGELMKEKRQVQLALLLTIGIAATTSPASGAGFSLPNLSIGGLRLPSRAVSLSTSLQRQLQGMGFQLSDARSLTSHGVTTHQRQLTRNGIEILGALALTHEGPAGSEAQASGAESLDAETNASFSPFDIATDARISSEEAARIALGLLGDRDLSVTPQLKILPSMQGDGSARLIYWVTVAPRENEAGRDVLLDANQGTLIADLSHDIEIAPSQVLIADDKCQVVDEGSGAPTDLDLASCPLAVDSGNALPAADETALRADTNARAVLKYYWTTHGRDSFDDQGSALTSVVHVGKAFNNAFWSSDRNFMAYGDGDGVFMNDLTKSLDVAGHEMTHGVTSQTSQLIYADQSGALNEAFSDFFGVVVAAREHQTAPDWAIGKEIFANERKLVGLRNLQNPGSILARARDDEGQIYTKPYPAHVNEAFTTKNPCSSANDRCFVHINSMIPGHAMYQIAEAIGLDKAEKLLYVTLTQYLTKTSNFKVFRTQTLKACRQLLSSRDCTKVRNAFKVVGL